MNLLSHCFQSLMSCGIMYLKTTLLWGKVIFIYSYFLCHMSGFSMSKISHIGRNFPDMNSGSKKLRELFPGLCFCTSNFVVFPLICLFFFTKREGELIRIYFVCYESPKGAQFKQRWKRSLIWKCKCSKNRFLPY